MFAEILFCDAHKAKRIVFCIFSYHKGKSTNNDYGGVLYVFENYQCARKRNS